MTAALRAPLAVEGARVFPVRHHSPRSSVALASFLDAVDPAIVLIEGPSDATDMLDVLLDPQTQPPVAILGYRTDGTPGSALWPFASYSPEYVAARWAHEHGRPVELIDIPIGVSLAIDRDEDGSAPRPGATEPRDDDDAGLAELAEPERMVSELIAEERGFRSFEEFWEASFEAPAYDHPSFRDALLAWADVVRLERPRRVDAARDAVMAAHVDAWVQRGTPADRIAIVGGAAHAAAFVTGDVDPSLAATLPSPVPTAHTIIPFSFPRLAAQLGYGAGNRAPLYYQRAHDAGGDYRRATLEALVAFTDHLRLRGFAASLADTIEAYRLALTLANFRGKAEPGLDEVREAAIATLTRGDRGPVDGFLWSSVVGHAVGRVAARIGRNSLQEEFWREVDVRRLPRTDEPERVILHLNNEIEVGTSVFLHRLRIGGIPYASLEGVRGGGAAAALQRLRESWEAQWTPATDAALVEAIVQGSTLEDVASDRLDRALAEATQSGQAAEVALEAVVASCPRTASEALAACERLAVDDADLPSLAGAARALSGLVAYGTSREHASLGDAAVTPLLTKVYARAVLRVHDACTGDDDAVEPAKGALRAIHEIAQTQPSVDRAAWIAAARRLIGSYAVNAGTSGVALALLYTAREVDEEALALLVGQRLSNRLEPVAAATFLAGFLEVNSVGMVRNRAVVAALDAYLTDLPVDRFKEALPVLRRAFTVLGSTERRYLAENLIGLRGIQSATAAQSVLRQGDTDALKQMNQDLAAVMDDLDDLL